MKPDEGIALLLTFCTGVFIGGALYVTVYAPQYQADEIEGKSQLSITGEIYGGCELAPEGCASFRLTDDRSYQYIATDEKEEGRWPNSLTKPLFAALTEYRLQSYAAPLERTDCQSYMDGVDYRYEITLRDTRYVIDTCQTAFPIDSELQQQLLQGWKYMDDPSTSSYPTWVENGFAQWVVERFQSGQPPPSE